MFQLISAGEKRLGEDLEWKVYWDHMQTLEQGPRVLMAFYQRQIWDLYSAHHRALDKIGEHLCLFFLANLQYN